MMVLKKRREGFHEILLRCPRMEVIEDGFHPAQNRVTESIMSLGNGYIECGATSKNRIQETACGAPILQVYYPDRTVVGWWKVGYQNILPKFSML